MPAPLCFSQSGALGNLHKQALTSGPRCMSFGGRGGGQDICEMRRRTPFTQARVGKLESYSVTRVKCRLYTNRMGLCGVLLPSLEVLATEATEGKAHRLPVWLSPELLSHFSDEEIEAKRGMVSCPKSLLLTMS